MRRTILLARACALLALAGIANPAGAFSFTVNYTDAAGSGFKDTTPVAPVGGNTGTTLGDQRKQAFEFALNEWAQRLKSNVTVTVNADWAVQTCSASSGVLGKAGPQLVADYPGAPQAHTFFALALAEALKGSSITSVEDIDATFNLQIDSKPPGGCLGSKKFYYGLDENTGGNVSFINVAVHELGHGLGFVSLIDADTGGSEDTGSGYFSIMDYKLFDENTAKFMVTTSGGSTQDTQLQRQSAAVSNGALVFNAANTNAGSSFLSAGRTASGHVRMFAPNPVQQGSSIAHWDSIASPNLVMEPVYSAIDASLHVDLTTCAFEDIGWQLCGTWQCPDISGNGGSCAGNTAPTLTQIANQAINEDTATGALAFTVGDAESSASSLTVSGSSSNTSLVPNPNIVFGGSGANRTVTVTPAADRSGSATITYTVNDGSTTTSKTFTLTVNPVNDAPTLNALSSLTIAQDAPQQTVQLAGIGAGPFETQALTVTATSSNTALIPNPTVTYASPSATGAIKFTPVARQSGASTITVTVKDDGGTANGGVDTVARQFTVTVTAASNHNPVAVNDAASVSQDSAETIINVRANDTDADGDTLTVTNVGAPNHGGSVAIRNAGANVGYTPANGFSGTETFSYTISDGHGGTADGTVTVTVNAVGGNHDPVAHSDGKTVDENSSETLIDVLANDTDADGDTLTITGLGATDHGGTVAIRSSNTRVGYTPANGFSGTETFTYTIADGHGGSASATVTVTVNPVAVNHDPVATNDAATVNQDSGETFINVLGNDSDADADALTVSALGTPNHGGTVAIRNNGGGVGYTPANGFSGSETFTYTVSDGHGGTANATVTVTVNAVSSGGDGGGGGGGGGSLGGATLLGLVAIGALRRRRR
ncbi:MAG TPA: Ig-like domain-containing protein [Nevskiaceae bacterium]|nr:Ig-like domain-containing protein [Nevskiaceae bacterium]